MAIKHVRIGPGRYHADSVSEQVRGLCNCYVYPVAEQATLNVTEPLVTVEELRRNLLETVLESFKKIRR